MRLDDTMYVWRGGEANVICNSWIRIVNSNLHSFFFFFFLEWSQVFSLKIMVQSRDQYVIAIYGLSDLEQSEN